VNPFYAEQESHSELFVVRHPSESWDLNLFRTKPQSRKGTKKSAEPFVLSWLRATHLFLPGFPLSLE
jgi:hypothetical protein